MVQHRGLVAVVSGCLILSNFSSALGVFILTFFQSNGTHNVIQKVLETVLSLMIQTFTVLLGSVFWKIRLNDKRPDLIVSIQNSTTTLGFAQIGMFIVFGFFNPLILNRYVYFLNILPIVTIGSFIILKIRNTDVLTSRYHMLQGALLFNILALVIVLSELVAKLKINWDLQQTNWTSLISTGIQDEEFSIVSAVAILIPLAKVFYLWIRGGLFSFLPVLQSKGRVKKPEETDDLSDLESLHFWNLLAALGSLLGGSGTLFLLTAAVYVGATVKTTVTSTEEENTMFFATHQKRGDLSF